jgi:hypothetical protein
MRATVLGRNVSGKNLIADRGINEGRDVGDDGGQAKGAGGAALLVGVSRRRVPVAFVAVGFRLHFRAAIGFLDGRRNGLAGKGGEPERSGEKQAEQQSPGRLHDGMILGRAGRLLKPFANVRLSGGR